MGGVNGSPLGELEPRRVNLIRVSGFVLSNEINCFPGMRLTQPFGDPHRGAI